MRSPTATPSSKGLAAAVLRGLSWFVPEAARAAGREVHDRARLIAAFAIFLALWGPVLAAYAALSGRPMLALVDLSATPLIGATTLALLRLLPTRGVAGWWLCGTLVAIVLAVVALAADPAASGTWGLVVVPFVALAVAGRAAAIVFSAVVLLCFGFFALVRSGSISLPQLATATAMRIGPFSVQCALTLASLALGLIFEGFNRRARRELEEANVALRSSTAEAQALAEKAEAASRAKSQFLAKVSHELRTPMNGVQGMLDLLRDTELSRVQSEYTLIARQSAASLLRLLEDLLDLSRMEAGKLTLQNAPFELNALIERIADLFAPDVAPRPVEWICRLDPTLPPEVVGDAARVRQVLTNLVDNALKFTARGEVMLHAERAAGDDDCVWVRFVVRDSGVGIPEARRAAIFEPFAQLDAPPAHAQGGVGLGLTIVRDLVEHMGGAVAVSATAGGGTTFTVELPFLVAEPAHATGPQERALEGLGVVVLQQQPQARQAVQDALAALGCAAAGTGSVDEAMALLADPAGRPAVVLVDGPQEAQLVDRLAAASAPRPDVVPMLRAGEDPPARGRSALWKPVTRSRIAAVLLGLQDPSPRTAAKASPGRAAPPAPARGRVLLVEDNLVNQKVARLLIEREGFEVDVVGDGLAAVAAAARGGYTVVFMDVQIPEIDGLEATRRIREAEARQGASGVPIVGLTAHGVEGYPQRCKDAGMTGYLLKPIDRAALARELRGALSGDPAAERDGSPQRGAL